MFCSKCGKQIPEKSAFCSFCGAPVAAGSVAAQNRPNISEQPPQAAGQQLATRFRLTFCDYLFYGLQLLALILAVFFPLVSDSGDNHHLAAIPTWSYYRKYYYMEEWEALQGHVRLLAVVFVFVVIALLVFSWLRNQRRLCAVGTLLCFAAYALIFLFLVQQGFVNPHGTYTFGLSFVFWLVLALLVVSVLIGRKSKPGQ